MLNILELSEIISIINGTGVFTVPLALGFFGGLLYLAQEKYLPCSKCKAAEYSGFKVV